MPTTSRLLRYTVECSDAPRRIVTFDQGQGHYVKALLRAHLRRRGHMQVTCLPRYQKRSRGDHYTCKEETTLTLFSRCRRRLHFSHDDQAHPSKISKLIPFIRKDLRRVSSRCWMRQEAPSLLLPRKRLRSDGRRSLRQEQQSP